MRPGDLLALARETFSEWRRDDALTLGAALAYYRYEKAGLFATVLAILATLFGATGVFAQLQASLDRIWNVPPPVSSPCSSR